MIMLTAAVAVLTVVLIVVIGYMVKQSVRHDLLRKVVTNNLDLIESLNRSEMLGENARRGFMLSEVRNLEDKQRALKKDYSRTLSDQADMARILHTLMDDQEATEAVLYAYIEDQGFGVDVVPARITFIDTEGKA